MIQRSRVRGEAGVADTEDRFRVGGGEGRQEQAEEAFQRDLRPRPMGVSEHGRQSSPRSSGALCHC